MKKDEVNMEAGSRGEERQKEESPPRHHGTKTRRKRNAPQERREENLVLVSRAAWRATLRSWCLGVLVVRLPYFTSPRLPGSLLIFSFAAIDGRARVMAN
jgi:hypothetical protein